MAKQVSYRELSPVIKDTVNSGGSFPLVVTGVSMKPFLNGRDTVILAPAEELCVGDIVLAEILPGVPFLHRIIRLTDNTFIMRGDAHVRPEPEASRDVIVAKVISVNRNNRQRKPNTPIIRFLVKLNFFRVTVLSFLFNNKTPSQ